MTGTGDDGWRRAGAMPRDAGVDVARLAVAFLIVALHALTTNADAYLHGHGAALLVITLARCGVPYFFVVAGYYLKPPRTAGAAVRRPLRRLVPMFLFWMAVYWLVCRILGQRWDPQPLALVNGGGAFHLWFLPAMAFALVFVGLGVPWAGLRATAVAAAVLLLVGPVAAQYLPTLTGEPYPASLAAVQRQLAAPLLVVAGYALKGGRRPMMTVAALLFAGAFVLLLAEEALLGRLRGGPGVPSPDVLATTVPFGVAAFLLARSVDGWRVVGRLHALGRLALPVYLLHVAVMWLVERVSSYTAPTILATFLIACAAAAVWLRIPGLRFFAR